MALKHSRLNVEKILINVLKALASIIFMCSVHVILLSFIYTLCNVTGHNVVAPLFIYPLV
jgi:hypothetical protein